MSRALSAPNQPLIALHGCVFAVAGYFRTMVDFQRAALPTEVASRSPNSDRGATSAGPGSHFWRVGSTNKGATARI